MKFLKIFYVNLQGKTITYEINQNVLKLGFKIYHFIFTSLHIYFYEAINLQITAEFITHQINE